MRGILLVGAGLIFILNPVKLNPGCGIDIYFKPGKIKPGIRTQVSIA